MFQGLHCLQITLITNTEGEGLGDIVPTSGRQKTDTQGVVPDKEFQGLSLKNGYPRLETKRFKGVSIQHVV